MVTYLFFRIIYFFSPPLCAIHHFHISHNALCLPPPPPPKKKKLHNHCSKFLLGRLYVPGEIENNAYAKFWGANRVYYGKCGNMIFKKKICQKKKLSREIDTWPLLLDTKLRSRGHAPQEYF